MGDSNPRDDDLDAARGFIWNLPLVIVSWAIILWLIFG